MKLADFIKETTTGIFEINGITLKPEEVFEVFMGDEIIDTIEVKFNPQKYIITLE